MTGTEPVFVDTNVLPYTLDMASPERSASASRWMDFLWTSGRGRLSWQVLNGFYENAVRKLKAPQRTARSVVETLKDWNIAEFNPPLVRRAWRWVDTAGVSYWDALILAAAEDRGCAWLLSEDFQHGRSYGSVRVIDPFQTDPDTLF